MIFVLILKSLFDSYPNSIKNSILNASNSDTISNIVIDTIGGVEYYLIETDKSSAFQTELKNFEFLTMSQIKKIRNDNAYTPLSLSNNYDNLGNQILRQSPFSAKTIEGKKLYKRIHGIQQAVSIGANVINFSIPYPQVKMNGAEFVGGLTGDIVSLEIYDDASGTYSTIPNYKLNQFGFNVNVSKDYYIHKSEYDADLYYGMVIKVTYTTAINSTIGINFILNEVK